MSENSKETNDNLKKVKKDIKSNSKQNTTKNITKNKSTNKTKKTLTTNKKEIKPIINEYYDLPQKYNQTIVKILAQTPNTLFIYWEISDDDIQKYKNQYGENFFETTKPILIVHNDTLNYSFEIEINDFANSWYLHVNDSNSDYRIELCRRPIENNNFNQKDITITSSNKIESPNDHILFDKNQKMVYFKNVKTDYKTTKSLVSLSFMKNIGKLYETYDLYQELYRNEESFGNLTNPSSQFK